MTDRPSPEQTGAFTPPSDPDLEAGLAAAFAGPLSVLEALRQRLPGLPSVQLPEPDSGATSPVVLPNPAELPAVEPGRGPGRYQFLGEIARGGMGSVLEGRDTDLGRDVAVKVLLERHAGQPELVCRFVEEAQIAGQLQHPGIVPVYEMGQMQGRPFYAMKLIKGHTLARLLETRSDRGQDLPRLVQIFEQVCQAMAYAHARGVIHRDLKPGNVMVGRFGEVLVMDWGLAKVLRRGGIDDEMASQRRQEAVSEVRTARSGGTADAGSDTQAGSVLGTPGYMAPEQARGEVDLVDERCDVFGLGAILCQILTGQPPFRGRNAEALRKAQTASLAEGLAALDGCGAEAELVGLAKRCLAAEPWQRPRDASAVAEAVGAYLGGVAERLRQAELGRAAAQARAAEEEKRRRLAVGLAAAVLLLVLAGGGGGVWWWQGRRELVRGVEATLAEADKERQAGRWAEVRAALARARGQLSGGGPAELKARVEQAVRDAAVVADLEQVRLRQAEVKDGHFHARSADEGYATAFREYGVDVEGSEPEEAAARVRGSAVREQLLAALDDWWEVRRRKGDRAGAERVRAVAEGADADEWRAGLRAAMAAGELERLKGLAEQAAGQPAAVQAVLARALRDRGAEAEAEGVLRRGLARHPADFWLAHELGQLLSEGKRSSEAEGYYRAALALRPDSPGVWLNLGNALDRQGKVDEAVACYRRAIELDPKYAQAHTGLGNALKEQGKVDEAVACYRRAIQLDPKLARAHNNLGNALDQQGKVDEAVACYRRAIQLDPKDARAHYNLGTALKQQGKLDEAVACYRRAIQLDPKLALAHYNLGTALYQQGKLDEAVDCFRRAIQLDPKYARAHCNLGQALRDLGRFREALTALETGHQLGSQSPGWRYPSAAWVRDACRLVELDDRLPAVLAGADRPTQTERLEFARVCRLKQRFAAAAGLYAEAFAAHPRLAADLRTDHRYNAACYAARAGCGQGVDADPTARDEPDEPDAQARRQVRSRFRPSMISVFRETAEDPVGIDVLGELVEVHVGDRQIVLHAPHFGRDDAECAAGLVMQVHNENRMIGMGESHPIDEEHEGRLGAIWHQRGQLLHGQPVVLGVTEALHEGLKFPHGLTNGRTDRLPGGIGRKVGPQHEGTLRSRKGLHEYLRTRAG
jgi:serine/threonine-protein kinase